MPCQIRSSQSIFYHAKVRLFLKAVTTHKEDEVAHLGDRHHPFCESDDEASWGWGILPENWPNLRVFGRRHLRSFPREFQIEWQCALRTITNSWGAFALGQGALKKWQQPPRRDGFDKLLRKAAARWFHTKISPEMLWQSLRQVPEEGLLSNSSFEKRKVWPVRRFGGLPSRIESESCCLRVWKSNSFQFQYVVYEEKQQWYLRTEDLKVYAVQFMFINYLENCCLHSGSSSSSSDVYSAGFPLPQVYCYAWFICYRFGDF